MEDDININNIFRSYDSRVCVDVSSLISSDWRTWIVSTNTMMNLRRYDSAYAMGRQPTRYIIVYIRLMHQRYVWVNKVFNFVAARAAVTHRRVESTVQYVIMQILGRFGAVYDTLFKNTVVSKMSFVCTTSISSE